MPAEDDGLAANQAAHQALINHALRNPGRAAKTGRTNEKTAPRESGAVVACQRLRGSYHLLGGTRGGRVGGVRGGPGGGAKSGDAGPLEVEVSCASTVTLTVDCANTGLA